MVGAELLAQTDTTGRSITLIIFGLLVVAVLLGGLTVWYWRSTDPHKRVPVVTVDPFEELDEDELSVEHAERNAFSDSQLLGHDDGADEWLRITSPNPGPVGR